MKLYHGTTSLRLNSILANGLSPRGTNATNWAARPSRPDLVYLTSAFPFFYGQHAVDDMDQEKILMMWPKPKNKVWKNGLPNPKNLTCNSLRSIFFSAGYSDP